MNISISVIKSLLLFLRCFGVSHGLQFVQETDVGLVEAGLAFVGVEDLLLDVVLPQVLRDVGLRLKVPLPKLAPLSLQLVIPAGS